MKFKIEKIYYNTANKDGKAYVDKNGKPYAIANMYVDENLVDDPEFNGKISFFDGDGTATAWKEGMELEGQIEKNDRGYFNFKLPSRLSILEERVAILEAKVFPKSKEEKEVEANDLPF